LEGDSTTTGKVLAWRLAGLVSLGLGLIGIILPLLPTTPFLLLAAFCFGRGSERLQRWLVEHPRLGPPIRNWQKNRAISRKAKRLAAIAMVLVVGASIALKAPIPLLITQIVVLALVGAFVFTRPSDGTG
jgi:uncharacterized membrane protein YbaN (DUF454 family)